MGKKKTFNKINKLNYFFLRNKSQFFFEVMFNYCLKQIIIEQMRDHMIIIFYIFHMINWNLHATYKSSLSLHTILFLLPTKRIFKLIHNFKDLKSINIAMSERIHFLPAFLIIIKVFRLHLRMFFFKSFLKPF